MTSLLSDYNRIEASVRSDGRFLSSRNEVARLAERAFIRAASEQTTTTSIDYATRSSFEDLFKRRLSQATPEEFDLAQIVFSVTLQLNAAIGATPVFPRHSLIDALSLRRLLNSVYGAEPPIKLLEFGNSHGLHSAFNMLLGGDADITEFSQSHFILQALFLNTLKEYKRLTANVRHLPWWEWLLQSEPISADVIVINNFLLSFSDELAVSTLRSFYQILQNSRSSSAPLLVCHLTSEDSFLSWSKLWKLAGESGFQLLDLGTSHTLLIPTFAQDRAQAVWAKLEQPFVNPLDQIVPVEQFETLIAALENR
jgi:hypothetical protein